MKIYIHQFLSRTGCFKSKKEIFEAIKNKEIKAEDRLIVSPYYQLYPKCKSVYWKGKNITVLDKKLYIILNKPKGYLSSKMIPEYARLGKKSLFELIKLDERTKRALFCIGRLDEDTSGLIIVTNDGKFCERITNPDNKIEKKYYVKLLKPLDKKSKENIEKGIVIELEENGKARKYKTRESKIEMKSANEIFMTIYEGKKREIKRIFESLRNKVTELRRISIGELKLKELGLKEGEYLFAEPEYIKEKIYAKISL